MLMKMLMLHLLVLVMDRVRLDDLLKRVGSLEVLNSRKRAFNARLAHWTQSEATAADHLSDLVGSLLRFCCTAWVCMQLFAVRSEASVLRMLEGSPEDFIHTPILAYLAERNVQVCYTLSSFLTVY